jgi:hypothetical protein
VRKIDGKFSTDGTRVFNTVSGIDIPEDEPLFIPRARDRNALFALREYLQACRFQCNDLHLAGIIQTIAKFESFRLHHPELMKQPGITRHLKLEVPENGA